MSILYTCNQRLQTPIRHDGMFRDRNFTVTVRDAADGKQIMLEDDESIKILNTIMRNSMSKLKLTRVNRDLFDNSAQAAIHMPELKLTVWPGYVTSIQRHDCGLLMCVDNIHKIIRNDNCYQVLCSNEVQNAPNPQEKFKEILLGAIVMSVYNNKTYRVEDIDFTQTALSTFQKRDGTEISFKDYFESRYQVKINYPKQPLILSKIKSRDRFGQEDMISLLPELVRPTGKKSLTSLVIKQI